MAIQDQSTPVISVNGITDLQALSAPAYSLAQGTLAFVASLGYYFSYQPASNAVVNANNITTVASVQGGFWQCLGASPLSSGVTRLVTSFVSSVTTPTGPAALAFNVYGGQNYAVDANLIVYGNTDGSSIGIVGPSGAQLQGVIQGGGTGTYQQVHVLNNGSTDTDIPFAGATGPVQADFVVVAPTGVTGTVQITMAQTVGGQTGAILAGSTIEITPSN